MEGALLRLRPKVMTVSTVVAGLLPLMWSTRVGAEVMKPLATPVLGGMVSSLVHVLIVTPVIFYWIRARRLPEDPQAVARADEQKEGVVTRISVQRRRRVGLGLLGVAVLAAGLDVVLHASRGGANGGRGAPSARDDHPSRAVRRTRRDRLLHLRATRAGPKFVRD